MFIALLTCLNSSLNDKVGGFADGTYTAVTGLAYDATNKKLGLKVGADTVIPFSSSVTLSVLLSNTGTGGTVTAPKDGIAVCIGWGYDAYGSYKISISSSCNTIIYETANGSRLYVGSSPVKKGDSIRITLSHSNDGKDPKDRSMILFIG